MIKRKALDLIEKLAGMFPAVMISGPRQSGKTTLVRNFIKGKYYDLERPSDAQVFSGDIETALNSTAAPLILDEAQTLPELFSVLRSVIDDDRKKNGRFYLLGSVNPMLKKNISETLAGRIGIVELSPFLFSELPDEISIDRLWLRGGFPDALLAKNDEEWFLWQENYLSTFVERDVVRMGLNMSPVDCRKFLMMLANCQGQTINASELGRAMGGISYHTINKYLDILEASFLLRRLPPYQANIGKRLVKSPKLYIRDCGVMNAVCGVKNSDDLNVFPKRGFSWEGLIVEQIIAAAKVANPGTAFYFYRTQAGAEIDLLADSGKVRVGFEIKLTASLKKHDWSNLDHAVREGICEKGKIVYRGPHRFPISPAIEAVPAEIFLKEL